MASGLPIVARDNRGHREIVASGMEGKLFSDGEGFKKAILELYNNPKRRIEIGKQNVKKAEKFSLKRSRTKMAEIYTECLES